MQSRTPARPGGGSGAGSSRVAAAAPAAPAPAAGEDDTPPRDHDQAAKRARVAPNKFEPAPFTQQAPKAEARARQEGKLAQLATNLGASLDNNLGQPHRLPALADEPDGPTARVYGHKSALSAGDKAECYGWAQELLAADPSLKEGLQTKGHMHVSLPQLLKTASGTSILNMSRDKALKPFTDAGWRVAAFELVLRQGNEREKERYKNFTIAGRLNCEHQDVRVSEVWFAREDFKGMAGSLRTIIDVNPQARRAARRGPAARRGALQGLASSSRRGAAPSRQGERWFVFKHVLEVNGKYKMADAPLLVLKDDIIAFDKLGAGSGGFWRDGGHIFHARRATDPFKLGVTITADIVAPAGQHPTGGVKVPRMLKSSDRVYSWFHSFKAAQGGGYDSWVSSRIGGGRPPPLVGAATRAADADAAAWKRIDEDDDEEGNHPGLLTSENRPIRHSIVCLPGVAGCPGCSLG
ncbi:hypothetical protein HT031_000317 [Scenedesmus sp. PABB004]|nr:hypothetical protein HT031_000317 [Scenedesmus sp. PABB004]